jgi:ATP-dependent Clp protease ATP-binding subunit ClpB
MPADDRFIDGQYHDVGAGKAEGDRRRQHAESALPAASSIASVPRLESIASTRGEGRGAERRFQKVLVDEPSVESTIAILRGLKERYELHHGVEITDPAIVAAAELSHATSPTVSCLTRQSI